MKRHGFQPGREFCKRKHPRALQAALSTSAPAVRPEARRYAIAQLESARASSRPRRRSDFQALTAKPDQRWKCCRARSNGAFEVLTSPESGWSMSRIRYSAACDEKSRPQHGEMLNSDEFVARAAGADQFVQFGLNRGAVRFWVFWIRNTIKNGDDGRSGVDRPVARSRRHAEKAAADSPERSLDQAEDRMIVTGAPAAPGHGARALVKIWSSDDVRSSRRSETQRTVFVQFSGAITSAGGS